MNDKIYEAYIGNLGKEFQSQVKKRLAWIASMINGNKILDIGCSQGILDILLARENKNVIGIDIAKEVIDKANELKLQEPKEVQDNLKFINMSYTQFNSNEKFDTIILGEIIEHFFYPQNLISVSYNFLKKDGALIITLPFGINDYFDHKKDYYLFDIINEINYEFKLDKIEYFENWIGLKVIKKEEKSKNEYINIEILKKFEEQINTYEYANYLKRIKLNEKIAEMNNSFNSSIAKMKKERDYYINLSNKYKNDLKKVNNRFVLRLIRKIKNINKISMPKKKTYSRKFYDRIPKYISNISSSNGSNYYKKSEITVGIITDEYMYNYYKDAINLKYITYQGYKDIIDNVDLVLFVSCWKGMNNNDWKGMTQGQIQNRVIEIFEYAKSKNIKTIFQTIEDPSNFNIFVPIAKHADYIFTSASEMIEEYKKETGNDNVYLLDYGVNPQFHNPISFRREKNKEKNGIFFAGSWAKKYLERCQDAEMIFDGVVKSGQKFVVADRNYGLNLKDYDFPVKYNKYLVPSIKHDDLQKVHKLFDWSLNLNSIKYSPTMCAMRVYELQAIGNLLISNYSMAVNNTFPNIYIVKKSEEVDKILNGYSNLDKFRMQVDGIRNVMSVHTVYDKLNYIFNLIGEKKYLFNEKKVLVLTDKKTPQMVDTFNKQTYKAKELKEISSITQDIVNKYDYVAFLSSNIYYKENYLQDMINAFKYTNSTFVTIQSKVINDKVIGTTYEYINDVKDIYKTIFDTKKFKLNDIISNNNLAGNGFCIDPFQITKFYKKMKKPLISVIVPIYNNGKHLIGKCFNSLLRCSMFENMEIILVDDGSNDLETKNNIINLQKEYSNVKTYFFNDNGSGSASRPRNKGVELATTEYVTFLDPDNELINDGYTKLYNKILEGNYDMTFGSILKLGEEENRLTYFKNDVEIDNPRETLIERKFKPQSIQACLIKKEVITKNKIENPIGAAGQDTLFFQEIMLNIKKAYYMNIDIHIYYASRKGSVINSINHKFFEKFYILEKYQVQKFKEYGVLKEYIEKKLDNFIKNWYYAKLELVTDEKEKKMSINIINNIIDLYKDSIQLSNVTK